MVEGPAPAPVARALRWLDGLRVNGGFRFAPGQPQTLVSTCLAVLLLEGAGSLASIGRAERSAWISYIKSCQAPGSGLFHDPAVDPGPGDDPEQLDWQATYLAIQALDALNATASHPLQFVDAFLPPNAVETWLERLDWTEPGLQSCLVMALLAAIIYRVECENRVEQAALYHRILDWLETIRNPETGLFGTGANVSCFSGLTAAYHLLPFFEYVYRPITGLHQVVDSALGLQSVDLVRGTAWDACGSLCVVDLLAVALGHTAYRGDEIQRELIRAYSATLESQNENGGFSANSGEDPRGKKRAAAGDLCSTWFRLLLLATVAAQLPGDIPAFGWKFRRWPALGFHDFGRDLRPSSAETLPFWIRRTAAPSGTGSPLVTVIVTCHNLGRYLHEAISSVLRQQLQRVRIIVVDDGSTDPFTKFLLDVMPWAGVELVRHTNRGAAASRNVGIQMASSPYICCLDADDRLAPEYLEKAVTALEEEQVGLVSCYYRLFDCEQDTCRFDDCRFPDMLVRNQAASASVFRKQAWRDAGGYNEELSGMEDWDLWIGILEAGYRAVVVREVLFEYRIRPGSKYTTTSRPDNCERLVRMIQQRHHATYARFFSDIVPLYARQVSEFVRFHREQVAIRERTVARLRGEAERLRDAGLAAEQHAKPLWTQPHRQPKRPARWLRRLRGAAFVARVLAPGGGCARRYRDLLLLGKAYANADARRRLRAQYSDAYYLAAYPDVLKSGIPGFLHYFTTGWREGRCPSENFDTSYYLSRYADVARAGVHPLLHYVLYGARENRLPSRAVVLGRSRWGQRLAMPPEHVVLDNAWPAEVPLVSVIIPAFNYGAYVEEAIQSVLSQTFPNYEIIVIESGSTDGTTPGRLRELQLKYPQIRFVFRPDRHLLGDNRNYGIQLAHGRYICCLDADDRLRPTYLEIAVFLAERYGYDVVYPSVQCFGDSEETWLLEDAAFPEILIENQVSVVALFRREVWEAVGGYRDWGLGEELVPEDWEFWVRVLGRGFRAKAIREPLMMYRIHKASMMANCKTGPEYHRRAIQEANPHLFEGPPVAPRESEVVNPWANLGPASPAPRNSVLLALPFLTIGGAEKLFFTLVRGLVERGYHVAIVTSVLLPDTITRTNRLFDPLTPAVYNLPELFPDQRCWPEFIHYLLRRYAVQSILIGGSEFLYHMLPRIRCEFPGVRVIDQLFNDTGHIVNNRRYAGLIDLNIVPSQAMAAKLVNIHGEDSRKVRVIPHAVPPDIIEYRDRDEAFSASGLPARSAGKFIVSFFGRLSEEKSPLTFVEIARRLASHSGIDFCMTGEGPERPAVLKLISRYRLTNRLYAPGFVPDVRPLIAASDVVVVPSRLDGTPLIVMEAHQYGKPVIASAVGGLPEMIEHGRTGFLCGAGDVKAFCSRIEELYIDPRLRLEMGQRARAAAAARWDSRKMIETYIAAFDPEPASRSAVLQGTGH
jgi:glycosyltransferase involved in cell wall biosynthesis